jgi:hypothetical protein
MTGDRRGAAMLLAVLLSTAATLLAHGLLVLAREELSAARIGRRVAVVERLAALGAGRALSRGRDAPRGLTWGAAAPLDSGVAAGAAWSGALRRLGAEIWLAEGSARDAGVRRAFALPAWRLDPSARVDALGAVVTTGGTSTVEGMARVAAGGFADPPPLEPAAGCPPDTAAGAPVPAWRSDPDSAAVRLGRLDLGRLLSLAELEVAGMGGPAALERFGACVDDPWNWGDPERPGRPCAARTVHVAVGPGAVVEGGSGQGVLVARGDLTLVDTRFYGVLLAQGRVRLVGRAGVTGIVFARAGLEIEAEARIDGSRCWALTALGVASLAGVERIPGSGWIRLAG